jgi:hypothetical protein
VREEEIEIDQKFVDNSFTAKVTFHFSVWYNRYTPRRKRFPSAQQAVRLLAFTNE